MVKFLLWVRIQWKGLHDMEFKMESMKFLNEENTVIGCVFTAIGGFGPAFESGQTVNYVVYQGDGAPVAAMLWEYCMGNRPGVAAWQAPTKEEASAMAAKKQLGEVDAEIGALFTREALLRSELDEGFAAERKKLLKELLAIRKAVENAKAPKRLEIPSAAAIAGSESFDGFVGGLI